MKIRNKLAILFTTIYAFVILLVLGFDYFSALNYGLKSFYSRLEERAFITSQVFLKKDELSIIKYEPFVNKFHNRLYDEIIQMYDIYNKNVYIEKSGKINITIEIINKIRNQKELRFIIKGRQFYGMYYHDNQGDFVIIASAIDRIGKEKLNNLLTMMIIGYLLSIIIIYFLGKYFAKKALEPITKIVYDVRNITATNLKVRVDEGRNKDEISELAMTFNNVLERLESVFEMQKTFVSNASHELRTPLTSMIAELEVLLMKERDNADYRNSLINILAEIQQLKDFINNLLSIAQTDISENNNLIEEIRLDEFLLELSRDIKNKNPNIKFKIELTELPDDTTQLTIRGNRQLLTNAFMNIIDNASKFSDNKEIVCSLSYSKHKLRIRIIDHGIGISEQDLKNLFQPFYRASNASRYPGHGVGLSLSEKIIKLHGGKIKIESEINKGTKVEVTF